MPGDNYLTNNTPSSPPIGDSKKAENYLNQIVTLVGNNQLIVNLVNTDDSSQLENYQIFVDNFRINITNSENSTESKYKMIFTPSQSAQPVIAPLVILLLSEDQYKKFKGVADNQITLNKKAADEKRVNEALAPIDQLFARINAQPTPQAPTNVNNSPSQPLFVTQPVNVYPPQSPNQQQNVVMSQVTANNPVQEPQTNYSNPQYGTPSNVAAIAPSFSSVPQ